MLNFRLEPGYDEPLKLKNGKFETSGEGYTVVPASEDRGYLDVADTSAVPKEGGYLDVEEEKPAVSSATR